MKIALSIDDALLQEADATARQMGASRSRLIALALGEYLQVQRREKMLEQLNRVYASGMDEIEKTTVKAGKTKMGRVLKDRW